MTVERLRKLLARVEASPLVAPDAHSTTLWTPYRHVDESDWRMLADALPALLAVADAAREVVGGVETTDWYPDDCNAADREMAALIAALAAAVQRLQEGKP